jgi:hypothetical protein
MRNLWLKIIVSSPFSFTTSTQILGSWHLEGLVTCSSHTTRFPCGVLTRAFSTRGLRLLKFAHYTRPKFLRDFQKKFLKNKKESIFHIMTHHHREGIGTHYPRKWIVSVSVRTEEGAQPLPWPLLHLSIPNLFNYHPQTLRHQHLFDKTMLLSTVNGLVKILVNNL